jgi:hypothetical protein
VQANLLSPCLLRINNLYKCGKIAFFDEKWILTDKDGLS